MGFSNEAKTWAQKIQDAAKAAVEKARGKRRQEAPTEVPTEAPAKAPKVAEVPAEAEGSTEVPGEIPAEEALEVAAVNDGALTHLARDEPPAVDGAVDRIATKIGHYADFVDRKCEPTLAAGELAFEVHERHPFCDARRRWMPC